MEGGGCVVQVKKIKFEMLLPEEWRKEGQLGIK
jgi:hypothetical protein